MKPSVDPIISQDDDMAAVEPAKLDGADAYSKPTQEQIDFSTTLQQKALSEAQVLEAAKASDKAFDKANAKGKVTLGAIVAVSAAVTVLVGLVAFGAMPRIMQQQTLLADTKKQMSEAPSVSVITAQPGAATEEFTLPGSTEAIQDAPIYARVNGYLHKRYVNIGDKVKAGQLLADIDTPEIDQQVSAAESNVQQATAAVESAREVLKRNQASAASAAANVRKGETDLQFYSKEVTRYQELADQGAISLEARDSRTQEYNAGVANLDSLRGVERGSAASINSAKAAVSVAASALNVAKAQLSQIQATRSFKNVTALFDGVVIKRNVDAGALVTSGSNNSNAVLFEIAKTDVLRVFVNVPEQYVPYIHANQQAHLRFQEYPGRDFTGIVTNVAGGLDSTSKTLQVEIHVNNGKHELMPGMYAKVSFQSKSAVPLPIIPATTLQTKPDGSFIYVVDAQNRAHMRRLEIGRDLGGQFEVASGVNAGEKVVVHPPDDLVDGMLVQAVPVPVTPVVK
ncbi:efflux RND transporter periplasmic adaptor subunit [soil metagenome]